VVRDGLRVVRVDEPTVDAVADLERDPTGSRGDDRDTLVDRLGDLDLEAFLGRELGGAPRALEDRAEGTVARRNTDDGDWRR
jgi:hypothetical protein